MNTTVYQNNMSGYPAVSTFTPFPTTTPLPVIVVDHGLPAGVIVGTVAAVSGVVVPVALLLLKLYLKRGERKCKPPVIKASLIAFTRQEAWDR
jgi:uncharacterized protein YybS (DUF2232 family)